LDQPDDGCLHPLRVADKPAVWRMRFHQSLALRGGRPSGHSALHVRWTMSEAKRALQLILENEDLIELARILMDDDAEGALAFLKKHLKGKSKDLLEGG